MARKLENYDFRRRGGAAKYPWNDWFDGAIWELAQGEDFDVAPEQFRRQAADAARKRGFSVQTSVDKATGTIVLQAYDPE